MGYRNVDSFVVIGADNRDPARSFANHRRRGSLGGVDVVAPFRTEIHAPDDCQVFLAPDNGSGGNTATLVYADGWRDQIMHLDEFLVANGARISQGGLVALSGRSGEDGRYTYDPHVHWHRIGSFRSDEWGSTNRYNPFDFFAGPAGLTLGEFNLADAQQILDAVHGYGRRVENIEAMTLGYGRRTENIETRQTGYGRRIEIIQGLLERFLKDADGDGVPDALQKELDELRALDEQLTANLEEIGADVDLIAAQTAAGIAANPGGVAAATPTPVLMQFADAVANELDAREIARLTAVRDA